MAVARDNVSGNSAEFSILKHVFFIAFQYIDRFVLLRVNMVRF